MPISRPKIVGALKDELVNAGFVSTHSLDKGQVQSLNFKSSYFESVAIDPIEAYGRSPMRGCSNNCSQVCGSRNYSRCC
jgi:hypothetical protein